MNPPLCKAVSRRRDELPLLIVTAAAAPHLQLGAIRPESSRIEAQAIGNIDDLIISTAQARNGPLLITAAAALPLTDCRTVARVPERIHQHSVATHAGNGVGRSTDLI